MNADRIGYLGLGVMGRGMSANLLKRLGSLTIWNRTQERARELVEQGARLAASPAELAGECDIVCVCVSDTPDVESVLFGKFGAAEALAEGKLVVDFSTISATATEDFAKRVESLGARWVDAPVSGGDVGARNGTLTIMAGGREEDFARALPVFEAVGRKMVHMGAVGSGQQTKLANQIAVCGTIASMAESMNFAREKGMDLEKMLDVVSSGAAGSWTMSNYAPRILQNNFDPGFSAALMAKDLRIVLENLDGLAADYFVVRKMADVFNRMVANGEGHLGIHAAVKYLGWK